MAALAVVLASTTLVYSGLLHADFVNLDDDFCVTANPHVQQGLSWAGVRWAFTTGHFSSWQPLTWLSHQAVCSLAGLNPMAHHLANLLFHLATTAILIEGLTRLSGAWGPSLFTGALFALHPLHVESVAWIAERKGIVCNFFFACVLLAYSHDVRRAGVGRLALATFLFGLGLMSKQMLVTMPFFLLLIDAWPLRRWHDRGSFGRCLLEKLPMVALALAFSLIVYVAEERGGSLPEMTACHWTTRLGNALLAYASYLGKALWPTGLAVWYPHLAHLPETPAWHVAAAAVLLVGLTLLAVAARSRWPYLFMGWFSYLGMLLPVIGIVQVGFHGMADRYTDLPLVGLYWALAFAGRDLARHVGCPKPIVTILAVAVLFVLGMVAWRQTAVWRESETLHRHAIAVTRNNFFCHDYLGQALLAKGRVAEAIEQFQNSLAIHPAYLQAHNNLGKALATTGRTNEALVHFRAAWRLDPANAEVNNNLGLALATVGHLDEARRHLETAVQRAPERAAFRSNLGSVLAQEGEFALARREFETAWKLDGSQPGPVFNLGRLAELEGRLEEAARFYDICLRLAPEHRVARRRLAWLYVAAPAIRDPAAALKLLEPINDQERQADPAWLDIEAALLAAQGQFERAVALAARAHALYQSSGHAELAAAVEKRVELYRRRQPYEMSRSQVAP